MVSFQSSRRTRKREGSKVAICFAEKRMDLDAALDHRTKNVGAMASGGSVLAVLVG